MVKEAQPIFIHSSFRGQTTSPPPEMDCLYEFEPQTLSIASDDSILRVFKLVMKKKPTLDF